MIMDETILFDLDGTLTDPKEGITKSVQYALRSFGIDEPNLDKLEIFIGPPLKEMFMEYAHLTEEQSVQAVAKYRERFGPIGILENRVYAGIPELLADLKAAGYKIGLATSKPEIYARQILDRFELMQYFDEVTGSELSGERIKKADVVAEALRRMNITAQQATMVGDRKHDVEGAHVCGVKCIGVLFGYGDRAEMEEAGADWICETVEDIRKILIY